MDFRVPSVSQGARSCPRDLEARSNACFTNYSFHSQSLYNSPQKLCCGIDVETLRAFCHSYTRAMNCIKQLKRSCPASAQPTIEKTLVNLDEAKAGIIDLCGDDSVVEAYAMYQDCFALAGAQSENCISTHLKNSASIRFLSKVSTKHKSSFCRNMRSTVKCVQRHVDQTCGSEAARLSVLLVRPMVRESSNCDYTAINPSLKNLDTQASGRERPPYVSGESRASRGSKSGSTNDNHRRNKDNTNGYNVKNGQKQNGGGGNSATCLFSLSMTTRVLLYSLSVCFLVLHSSVSGFSV